MAADYGPTGRAENLTAPRTLVGFLIGPIFLLVAVWLAFGSDWLDIEGELGPVHAVDPALLSTAPRRDAIGDPPKIFIEGFERTCMDCHRLFPAREVAPSELLQHKHIVLDHGINDRCRNCHYEKNRDKLVMHDGTVVGFDRSTELCAKCHGPTFRDWERGAHGRTNGYWDAASGTVIRLRCAQCHNPHQPRVPAMDPIEPLPAPNTLRMGDPGGGGHGDDEGASRGRESPLRQPWK